MNAPEIRFFKGPSGRNVAYAVHGEGPLVICPAWWVSHVEKDWAQEPFRRFFSRLGEGLRVVRYDRLGVGLSDRDSAARSLDDEVALLSALIDELGADELSFFGVSCGGPPALVYAARGRATVNKVCLYGSFARGDKLGPPEVQDAVTSMVRAHWGMGSRALADLFLPDEPREAIDELAAWQRAAADVDVAAQLLALTYKMDASPFLPDVSAECLVIHRRGDRAMPHEAGRRAAAGLNHARLVTFEGRAHPPWVRGDEIADLANAFLRGDAPSAAPAGPSSDGCRLDTDNRRLVVDGEPVSLTPLEFAVMREMTAARDQVVTRDYLLETVWKQPYEGSNRIDALIRGLRRKLGPYAGSIETVIGHGYRFIGWRRSGE